MERDNDAWFTELRSDGPVQRAALSELRAILVRSLRGALAKSGSVNDSFLEDVVQDTLLLILDRLEQFEGRSRFLSWATSIAVRSAMTQLRRKSWKDVSLEQYLAGQSDSHEIFADKSSTPDQTQVRSALVGKMMALITSDSTRFFYGWQT